MTTLSNLRLSLTKFSVTCVNRGSFGLHFVKCFIFRTHEEVVTDRLLVSKDGVRVLDKREYCIPIGLL
jgi:hypothetical protein